MLASAPSPGLFQSEEGFLGEGRVIDRVIPDRTDRAYS